MREWFDLVRFYHSPHGPNTQTLKHTHRCGRFERNRESWHCTKTSWSTKSPSLQRDVIWRPSLDDWYGEDGEVERRSQGLKRKQRCNFTSQGTITQSHLLGHEDRLNHNVWQVSLKDKATKKSVKMTWIFPDSIHLGPKMPLIQVGTQKHSRKLVLVESWHHVSVSGR